jgi:hypothetical protein
VNPTLVIFSQKQGEIQNNNNIYLTIIIRESYFNYKKPTYKELITLVIRRYNPNNERKKFVRSFENTANGYLRFYLFYKMT